MACVGPVQLATVAAPSLAHGQGSLPLKLSKKLLVPWMRRPPGHFASGARRGLPWVIHKSLLLGFSLVILPALGPVQGSRAPQRAVRARTITLVEASHLACGRAAFVP